MDINRQSIRTLAKWPLVQGTSPAPSENGRSGEKLSQKLMSMVWTNRTVRKVTKHQVQCKPD